MTAPALKQEILENWIKSFGHNAPTPAYVYDDDVIRSRVKWLADALDHSLEISFAIKSNPNPAILKIMSEVTPWFDASSWAEVQRALDTGKPAASITYSGPGKRIRELEAAVKNKVPVVVESFDEIEQLICVCRNAGSVQNVLIRINPDYVPRGFGASMSGKPSQFGIDENLSRDAVDAIDASNVLNLIGLHIYTGSNALSADPIVENFENMARLFLKLSDGGTRRLDKLIFGSGFGIPYHSGQEQLDVLDVCDRIRPVLQRLRDRTGFAESTFILEMGRWLVGPAGALVTQVLSRKQSRGQEIAVCDAGFNNHLAACGMMGATFRKDYPIVLLGSDELGPTELIKLTGPLCTSIDALAGPLELGPVKRGDAIAIMQSGAYGLTASPTRFISHPDPVEILHQNGGYLDITEHKLNHVLS